VLEETDSDSAGRTRRENGQHKSVRRLRHYALELKRRIVEESFAPNASVSVVARRHDVNANLVFEWRRKYREGTLVDKKVSARAALAAPDLLRIGVVDHGGAIRPLPVVNGHSVPPPPETGRATVSSGSNRPAPGMVVIELPNRIKVRVEACIDESALRRVLAVIREVA